MLLLKLHLPTPLQLSYQKEILTLRYFTHRINEIDRLCYTAQLRSRYHQVTHFQVLKQNSTVNIST